MPAGRPSSYTAQLADAFCELICSGNSVRALCARDEFPSEDTIYRWIGTNPEFAEKYARAKQICLLRMEEELLEICDDGSNDWMERELEGGKIVEIPDHEHINRSRLRVDTRKWLMSKLMPKKYGDKLEHTGPDGGPIVFTMQRMGK